MTTGCDPSTTSLISRRSRVDFPLSETDPSVEIERSTDTGSLPDPLIPGHDAASGGEGTGGTAAVEARRAGSVAANEAKEVAGTAGEAAKQVARSAGEQAREVAQEAARQAGNLAGEARHQLKRQAEQEADRAASNLMTLSEQARALSEGRIEAAGPLADQVGRLADQLADVAARLRSRGFDGVVEDVRSFARRRPAAFIGLTALAGFAVTRIVRTASSSSNGGPDGHAIGGAPGARTEALPGAATSIAGRLPPASPVGGTGGSQRADTVLIEDDAVVIEDIARDRYERPASRVDMGGS
jgi:hypothetical protein